MKISEIQSVKNNGIKNILNCFLIIVFANVFWACEKYETETRVNEVRIVSASITEVGTTTAEFTIIVSGGWMLDNGGIRFWGYTPDVNFLWSDWVGNWETKMSKSVVRIEGLSPGTNYGCQAYIEVGTLSVYSEMEYFTTDSE